MPAPPGLPGGACEAPAVDPRNPGGGLDGAEPGMSQKVTGLPGGVAVADPQGFGCPSRSRLKPSEQTRVLPACTIWYGAGWVGEFRLALIVMINCLATDAPVSTGIHPREEWRMPGFSRAVKCPGCGRLHPWNKLKSWVSHQTDEPPAVSG